MTTDYQKIKMRWLMKIVTSIHVLEHKTNKQKYSNHQHRSLDYKLTRVFLHTLPQT